MGSYRPEEDKKRTESPSGICLQSMEHVREQNKKPGPSRLLCFYFSVLSSYFILERINIKKKKKSSQTWGIVWSQGQEEAQIPPAENDNLNDNCSA